MMCEGDVVSCVWEELLEIAPMSEIRFWRCFLDSIGSWTVDTYMGRHPCLNNQCSDVKFAEAWMYYLCSSHIQPVFSKCLYESLGQRLLVWPEIVFQ